MDLLVTLFLVLGCIAFAMAIWRLMSQLARDATIGFFGLLLLCLQFGWNPLIAPAAVLALVCARPFIDDWKVKRAKHSTPTT